VVASVFAAQNLPQRLASFRADVHRVSAKMSAFRARLPGTLAALVAPALDGVVPKFGDRCTWPMLAVGMAYQHHHG